MRRFLLAILWVAPVLAADPRLAEARGRGYYMLGEYKKAAGAFQEAVAAEPGASEHYMWLGRALGRRAEHCSPLTAPAHAVKARQNFEKAVELDPRNLEAMSDLFEYYLEAPGFLGVGVDKAAGLAAKIAALDPVEGHYARYRLAEKSGDKPVAEQSLRRAAALAPQQPGRPVDLARFLARQGRYEESDRLFHSTGKLTEAYPKILFDRADTYIQSGRNLDVARQLLKRYLAAELTPDDPPRHEAEKLLKRLTRS